MRRTPVWASASLLAVAIALAGCGEEKKDTAAASAEITASTGANNAAATANWVVSEDAAQAVVAQYADIAYAIFSDAHTQALALQKSIDAFLATPNADTLAAARQAWIAARVPYMQSEVFRFGNPVVDDWEGQVNAWPLDEGLIDYVAEDYQFALGNPAAHANIIANPVIRVGEEEIDLTELTGEKLASLNELAGAEANVATGYHAIEFLLWGQDLNGTEAGAGDRPASDYLTGEQCTHGNCDRRAQYLRVVTQLLVDDLAEMADEWKPNTVDNYRAELTAEPARNGLRKMLFGMGSLSLGELAGERMKVSLEANSPEDEHDCFSDNTHNSHFYNALGIRNVYLGEYKRVDGTVLKGPSLSELVKAQNPAADETLKADLDATQEALEALVISANNGIAFDQLIAPDNLSGNALINTVISALVKQTAAIEQAAAALQIDDLNPDTADHAF